MGAASIQCTYTDDPHQSLSPAYIRENLYKAVPFRTAQSRVACNTQLVYTGHHPLRCRSVWSEWSSSVRFFLCVLPPHIQRANYMWNAHKWCAVIGKPGIAWLKCTPAIHVTCLYVSCQPTNSVNCCYLVPDRHFYSPKKQQTAIIGKQLRAGSYRCT